MATKVEQRWDEQQTEQCARLRHLGDENAAVGYRARKSLINITGGVDMGTEPAAWRGLEKFVTLSGPAEKPRPWYDAGGWMGHDEELPPSDIAPLPSRPTTRPASRAVTRPRVY